MDDAKALIGFDVEGDDGNGVRKGQRKLKDDNPRRRSGRKDQIHPSCHGKLIDHHFSGHYLHLAYSLRKVDPSFSKTVKRL